MTTKLLTFYDTGMTDKFGLVQEQDEAQVIGLKTKCPECNFYTDAKDSFYNESVPEIGKDIEAVGVKCGKCGHKVVAYYTDNRLRQSTLNVRRLRERTEQTKMPIQSRRIEYEKARNKHRKLFDRLQKKIQSQLRERQPIAD